MARWNFCKFFQLLCLGSLENRCQKVWYATTLVIFGLDWNWTATKNCFRPRLKIEPRPKTIFCLGWNWTAAKKCFLPRLRIEPRPKCSLEFKNRESLFFFFFLACAFSLSATHIHCCCCRRPLAITWRLDHSCSSLAKCDLGLAKWASVRCVTGAW